MCNGTKLVPYPLCVYIKGLQCVCIQQLLNVNIDCFTVTVCAARKSVAKEELYSLN